jgi:hypothetical protein
VRPDDVLRLVRQSPACVHPPRLASFGGFTWVLGCGFACCGGEPCVAVAFAFSRRCEVPRSLLALGSTAGARETLAGLFSSPSRVGEATVRRCIPRVFFEAARALGVTEWRRGVLPSGVPVALGVSLGLPACAVSPYAGGARRLAEGAP